MRQWQLRAEGRQLWFVGQFDLDWDEFHALDRSGSYVWEVDRLRGWGRCCYGELAVSRQENRPGGRPGEPWGALGSPAEPWGALGSPGEPWGALGRPGEAKGSQDRAKSHVTTFEGSCPLV